MSGDLAALERTIERALASGDESALEVIGYGEVTTVLRLRTSTADLACKRLTPFRDRASALRCAEVIRGYVDALSQRGIEVVETELATVAAAGGREALYCVQPVQRPESLGPAYLGSLRSRQAVRVFERILGLLVGSVSRELAPDGQLSNWAFVDEQILYLDVTSPFQRDAQGNELFDWRQQLEALPAPLRWPVRRFVLPGLLETYHSLRGQALDFLGNLEKEGLGRLVPDLLPVANRLLGLEPPIDGEDVRRYYRSDARTYALLQALRRGDRWVRRRLLRQTYPYLLPPRIDRHRSA